MLNSYIWKGPISAHSPTLAGLTITRTLTNPSAYKRAGSLPCCTLGSGQNALITREKQRLSFFTTLYIMRNVDRSKRELLEQISIENGRVYDGFIL